MSLNKLKELPYYSYYSDDSEGFVNINVVASAESEALKLAMENYLHNAFVISRDIRFINGIKDKSKCNYKYYLPNACAIGVIMPYHGKKRYRIFKSSSPEKTYIQNKAKEARLIKHLLSSENVIEISNVTEKSYREEIKKALRKLN